MARGQCRRQRRASAPGADVAGGSGTVSRPAVPGAGSTRLGRAGTRATGGTGAGAAPSRPGLRQQLIGWGFALPFVLIFAIFMAGPIAASMVLSLTDFGLRDLRN